MIKNDVVYCPHCNEVLLTEITNHEQYGKYYIDSVNGKCPQCERVYNWEEVFRLADIINFCEETTES